jgi:hypothetical protein
MKMMISQTRRCVCKLCHFVYVFPMTIMNSMNETVLILVFWSFVNDLLDAE